MAIMADMRIPSVKQSPMKCCRLGVNRNGTTSCEAKTGSWFDRLSNAAGIPIPGSSSLMAIRPVLRDMWNLLGSLLVRKKACVMKHAAASWRVNCFRIRQRSDGVSIVRVMYC